MRAYVLEDRDDPARGVAAEASIQHIELSIVLL